MSRFALSPRAALVLVGVVVLVAVGVVWLGGGADGDGSVGTGVTVVSGAPTVAASDDGGAAAAGGDRDTGRAERAGLERCRGCGSVRAGHRRRRVRGRGGGASRCGAGGRE
ncbi:hypothetical protein [Curtobacterium sp. MCJR17_043]|uniref:hypothetical protein n=1 Tax=Curtobacterium sp. MCJR17_043 TaxID=2175660 RepID=UPI0024DF3A20|nr:hypothetical protein [Curtobacterium sp. MCJR17_043]WIB34763.1 hypothetical protein DEJ15_09150 [Curtobacterium sp. MCJR17_043]